ncbi:acyl-CoA dehydratase activase [Myxococcota bacterium]|nr:acyl-CoA dehydratase activase [Myxococcota bacterium]
MRAFIGIDLGSTTTKAVMLDEDGHVLGRGITNSRSNYHLAADIARDEAFVAARFTLLDRALEAAGETGDEAQKFRKQLHHAFRKQQQISQLHTLAKKMHEEAEDSDARARGLPVHAAIETITSEIEREWKKPKLGVQHRSDFFRDQAASDYSRIAERIADRVLTFDMLLAVFDKAILQVENQRLDLTFEGNIRPALKFCLEGQEAGRRERYEAAVLSAAERPIELTGSIGTGYGRQRLPFPKENIRSEILCHGLGAHLSFPNTRTVLDIGGQDTKAIQVDENGIVTSFQMNDRCAAGCGRYLGYIADEMNLGVHELGPMAMTSTRHVKINSTCTVFAGAELRDRLATGQRREDILAGLHRAIILRAMALLARSGGVTEELTFTGGVANNGAAVSALRKLVEENYGERTLNISASSIYTGALGAATFALRAARGAEEARA